MKLSPHFTLAEGLHSQTAARLGIDNTPSPEVLANMRHAAEGMEKVRRALNSNAIHVSSWLRVQELNRAIGSKDTSAHITGFAVDFTAPTFGTPEQIVRRLIESSVPFQQLILEFPDSKSGGWVHAAFNGTARKTLIIDSKGARAFV